MPTLARSPRRLTAAASTTLVLGILLAAGAVVPSATGAPGGERVTICHRTHATTNPYRLITVSANAADGLGANDHSSHDDLYVDGATSYPVFDPTVDYPANQKLWGDIIPPVRNGDGLNWTTAGQAIYAGTGSSFGLCRRLSAKQFYDLEVAAGEDPAEVLADLDEQSSLDDAAELEQLGIDSFSDLDPAALPDGFTNSPPAPLGVRPPAGYVAEPGRQKIAVFVWYDTDRDGAYDENESPASGIDVTVGEVVVVTSAGFGVPSTLVMAADTLVTDADGLVIKNDIPAGQWEIGATPPDAHDVTYDSEGLANDGEAQVDVPANSAGFAWVGLVPTDDGGTGGGDEGAGDGDPALADTGAAETAWMLGVASALLLLGFALLARAARLRRRAAAR